MIIKNIKGKKADEKLLSIWWLLVLAMIGVGIIFGVSIFYSVKIDTRAVESEILADQVLNCIVKQGKIIDEAMQNDFDIGKCYLKKELFDKKEIFYLNVSFYDESGKTEKSFAAGPYDLYVQCLLKEESEAEYFSECAIKNVIATQNGKLFFVKIIAASNQVGEGL